MKILVTGASGFTGGALAKAHARRGDEVVALVRDPESAAARGLAAEGITLAKGDIREADAVARAAQGVGLIQHIAAVYRTAGHRDDYYHAVNDGGVANVITAAQRHGVGRVVHCSTIGVHGHVSEVPAHEDSAFNPGDIYQRSKLAGENRFRAAVENGLPGVIFRPAAIYGPGDLRLLKIFRGVQRGRFPMFGDGQTTYQLVYIDDLVDGIIACGTHPAAVGQTFILCGEGWVTLDTFVGLVAAATGGRTPRVHWPMWPLLTAARVCETVCRPLGVAPPLHVRRCEFYVKSRAFTNERAREMIGFAPKVSLREGAYRTAAWYAEQGLIGPIPSHDAFGRTVVTRATA